MIPMVFESSSAIRRRLRANTCDGGADLPCRPNDLAPIGLILSRKVKRNLAARLSKVGGGGGCLGI